MRTGSEGKRALTQELTDALDAYRGELLRFLTARTGDVGAAEDIVQEIWIRCRTVEPDSVGNVRAYLYRMGQNLVLDRLKVERRRMARDHAWSMSRADEHGAEIDRPDAEQQMIEQERTDRFASAIAALPPATGQAFRLHKVDGLGQAEVAVRMGISRSGVEKHIARAMVYLRRALSGED